MSIKDENRIPELLRELEHLKQHRVEIGIFGEDDSEIVERATTHEFGNAYNPERSFIRAGWDSNADDIFDAAETLVDDMFASEVRADDVLTGLGAMTAGRIQDYLTKMTFPPLSPMTIKRKGSSKLLIDTGQMRDSITWKVR